MSGKIKVLLADDHAVLREATAELIGHQPDMVIVGQVGTGEEAVQQVEDCKPDVVVMDVAMPRNNGLEATRRIVANFPKTRVLVLSAHQDAENVIPLLEAGATGYLPKTVSLVELLDAIRATYKGESVLPTPIASLVVKHISGESPQLKETTLTDRELEVLHFVARGCTNDQIAHELHLSKRTIEAHLTHIFNKLSVSSRTEAALLAERKGWFKAE